MSIKPVRFPAVSALAVTLAILLGGATPVAPEPASTETVEPRPAEVLELVQVSGSGAQGTVTLEAILHPEIDADVELEVVRPAKPRLLSSRRSNRYTLSRGGPTHKERLELSFSGDEPRSVLVRVHFLNEAGERWMNVDREIRLEEPLIDPGQVRVPVVRTAPDGSRRVEYLKRENATRSHGAWEPLPRAKPPDPSPAPPLTGSPAEPDPPSPRASPE